MQQANVHHPAADQLASTQSALQNQQRISANLANAYVPQAEQSAIRCLRRSADWRSIAKRSTNSLNDLSIVSGVGNNNSLSGLHARLMKDSTAQHRWDNLSLRRSIYLRRAIDCSSLTIPSLIPESDQNYAWGAEPYSRLDSLYQGAGARGVSGLSAKLLLALMPPSQPFFKLSPQGAVSNFVDQSSEDPQKTLSEIDVALSDIEQQVLRKLDKLKARTALFEACKHLVVGGNALLYVGPDGIKMFSLRSYCVSRDPEGNVSEIVVREEVAREFLPPGTNTQTIQDSTTPTDVYTWIKWKDSEDRVEWHQEHEGKKIPGTQGFSRVETCPWIPLRLHRIAGESYGRSLCDEVIGDLQSLESSPRPSLKAA